MTFAQDLGRATWWHLHWAAQQPGAAKALPRLVALLRQSYPCIKCRRHLPSALARRPPTPIVDVDVPLWMASFHNSVRRAMGAAVVLGPVTDELRGPLRALYGGPTPPPPHHDERVREWIALLESPINGKPVYRGVGACPPEGCNPRRCSVSSRS